MNEHIYNYQPLWGCWIVEDLVSKSSHGNLYRISKKTNGQKVYAYAKIISFPSEEELNKAIAYTGTTDQATLSEYFDEPLKEILNDIDNLQLMKGKNNIQRYDEYLVNNRANGFGWDIIIRMEYAIQLKDALRMNDISEQDVINLGKSVCGALETCRIKGIFHRDIREESIFIGRDGSYKLGNYGVLKEYIDVGEVLTQDAAVLYMAPEIISGNSYSTTADIYSLGMLMYKLLNKGRFPFFPPYPQSIVIDDVDRAQLMRLKGAKMPKPINCSPEVAEIILKACAFRPGERYRTPADFYSALASISYAKSNIGRNVSDNNSSNFVDFKKTTMQYSEELNNKSKKNISNNSNNKNTENKSINFHEKTVALDKNDLFNTENDDFDFSSFLDGQKLMGNDKHSKNNSLVIKEPINKNKIDRNDKEKSILDNKLKTKTKNEFNIERKDIQESEELNKIDILSETISSNDRIKKVKKNKKDKTNELFEKKKPRKIANIAAIFIFLLFVGTVAVFYVWNAKLLDNRQNVEKYRDKDTELMASPSDEVKVISPTVYNEPTQTLISDAAKISQKLTVTPTPTNIITITPTKEPTKIPTKEATPTPTIIKHNYPTKINKIQVKRVPANNQLLVYVEPSKSDVAIKSYYLNYTQVRPDTGYTYNYSMFKNGNFTGTEQVIFTINNFDVNSNYTLEIWCEDANGRTSEHATFFVKANSV